MLANRLRLKRALLAILMLLHGIELTRSNLTYNPFKPSQFDTYVMSMSYIPYFCSIQSHKTKDECKLNSTWLVHGLWPNFSEYYRKEHNITALWPEFCVPFEKCSIKYNLSSSCTKIPEEECKEIMGEIWCKELGVHEWIKHGSCTGLSHINFYVQMQQHGYAPNIFNLSRKLVHISMLNKYVRNGGNFVCSDSCDVSEYRECYEKQENNEVGSPVECESDNTSCSTSCEWVWID